MKEHIKLFTDPSWMPSQQSPCIWLAQLTWGQLTEDPIYQDMGRFDQFFEKLPEAIEWTATREEADFWILPADYKQYKRHKRLDILQSVVALAMNEGKWPLIQYKDDGDDEIPFERLIVLRTSFYRHLGKAHEYAMPVWSEDIFKHYSLSLEAVNLEIPSIGFTGMASKLAGLHALSFELLLRWQLLKPNPDIAFTKRYSAAIRHKLLEHIKSDARIQSFFHLRNQYIGGSWLSKGQIDQRQYKAVRQDFINNLREVDYIADFRGGGNYTLRLYETLCAGRIPVMLDSDRVLPLEELIDWEKYMVIIPFPKLRQAHNILLSYHSEHAHQLAAIKSAIRKLWEDYIAPESYYKHLFIFLQSRYKDEK